MRFTFVASLLVFILREGSKPVGGGKKMKQLKARVKALEECQLNI